jgi:hypothetical protein
MLIIRSLIRSSTAGATLPPSLGRVGGTHPPAGEIQAGRVSADVEYGAPLRPPGGSRRRRGLSEMHQDSNVCTHLTNVGIQLMSFNISCLRIKVIKRVGSKSWRKMM